MECRAPEPDDYARSMARKGIQQGRTHNCMWTGKCDWITGANCYHIYHVFIPGISERNWTDEWLEEQNRKESIPKIFNGKEYTLYEAKQQQRKKETAMRAQREKVALLKQGGADPGDVIIAKAKYQGQLGEYTRFCKRMGLHQERERIITICAAEWHPYQNDLGGRK